MAPKKKKFPRGDTPEEERVFAWLRSPTAYLAQERWQRLLRDKNFSGSLEKTRNEFKIPSNLKPETDGYTVDAPVGEFGETVDLKESRWKDSLIPEKKRAFDKAIKSLIDEYELTIDFDDHVQYWLLYGEAPKWIAPLGVEHALHAILENPEELRRVPLNTAEKKFLLQEFRKNRGIKNGRPSKKDAHDYRLFLQLLARFKNTSRRSRTYKTAVNALSLKEKPFWDNRGPEKISSKKTYIDVAAELTPITDSDKTPLIKEDKRAATRLRARTSRFLRRGKKEKVKK